MAENKKSFILYLTQRPTFDGLDDADAGKLIKTIFSYVSDEHPKPEGIIKYAFEIIKPVLKADLVKYEDIRKAKSEGGKKHTGNQYTLKDKQTKRNTMEDTSKNGTNGTVIVNDIVIDNVNDISKDINNNDLSNSKELSKSMAAISNDNRQPTIILPCVSNYNHPIFEEDIEHYKELYPAVDILTELKKMLGWLESNPSNKKTKNGIKAFISRWLSKCQDRAPKVETESSSCGFVDFQKLGETDEEYEKRTGVKRYRAKSGGFGEYDVVKNFDDPDGFGGNEL